jgi:hypothetical protein
MMKTLDGIYGERHGTQTRFGTIHDVVSLMGSETPDEVLDRLPRKAHQAQIVRGIMNLTGLASIIDAQPPQPPQPPRDGSIPTETAPTTSAQDSRSASNLLPPPLRRPPRPLNWIQLSTSQFHPWRFRPRSKKGKLSATTTCSKLSLRRSTFPCGPKRAGEGSSAIANSSTTRCCREVGVPRLCYRLKWIWVCVGNAVRKPTPPQTNTEPQELYCQ